MINQCKRILCTVLILMLFGCTNSLNSNASKKYESRRNLWFPQINKSLMVIISHGSNTPPSRGLWSGLFLSSRSRIRLEPHIQRADGTFLTSHALISQEDMKALLNKIDSIGTKNNFTTCGDSNRTSPNSKEAHVEVTWQSNLNKWTYDRYALPSSQMKSFLNELRDTLKTKKGKQVLTGLLQGYVFLQPVTRNPQPATRKSEVL